MPRPKIFLVGGPSGAGKDALLAGAREKAADVAFVVRDVTRAADQCSALERSVSPDEFATGEYALRWSAHGTTDYGIPAKALEDVLAAGSTIVLNVSRGAFAEARQKYAERADVYVLLVTASREALRERLSSRARDGDDAEARLKRATAYAPPDANFGAAVVRVRNDNSLEEGVDRFVAALTRPEKFCVPVLGLVGCSASGKSTLCAELPAAAVIAADDFYLPRDACPFVDLAAEVRWPSGELPTAFQIRGGADLNHPDSVDWAACADAVDAAVEKIVDAGGGGVVVVEGLLLLGAGAERVRDRCAQLVLLDDGYDDPAKQEVLWRRKWTRTGHLAKTSYQQRGVTADEFAAYWGDCVSARWKEHGLDRVEAAGRPIHRVDAHADDRSAQVERILRALEHS